MEFKDYLTLSVSLLALVFSVYNFFRSSRISSRQYALAFSKPIVEWAGEVMEMMAELYSFNRISDDRNRIDKLGDFHRRLVTLALKGTMTIEGSTHYLYKTDDYIDTEERALPLKSLDAMIALIQAHIEKLRADIKLRVDEKAFGELIAEFGGNVSKLLRVRR